MRRGARLSEEELAPYLFEANMPRGTLIPSAPCPLVWSELFGNANPVEIEVGFGKGLFLVSAGQAHPDRNFFGIEIERKYTLFTATRLAKRGLSNVKVAACDARWLLRECVADAGVAVMHVYFPDPWWKNRHRKRRLFTPEFAVQCVRVLQTGGGLCLVSDVEDYFNETAKMLEDFKELTAVPAAAISEARHEMDYLTNFERKYRKEGRAIYRGEWRKS